MHTAYIKMIGSAVLIFVSVFVFFNDSFSKFIKESAHYGEIWLIFCAIWAVGGSVLIQGLWQVYRFSTRSKVYRELCCSFPELQYSNGAQEFAKSLGKKHAMVMGIGEYIRPNLAKGIINGLQLAVFDLDQYNPFFPSTGGFRFKTIQKTELWMVDVGDGKWKCFYNGAQLDSGGMLKETRRAIAVQG